MADRSGAMLVHSDLTGRIYVLTRWKVNPDGTIVASKKHDVTDQFEAIEAARNGGDTQS